MEDELEKIVDYFKRQSEKLKNKIFEQNQMIENINDSIRGLREHISIIKKDITRENNPFYPAGLKSKLSDKMESLITKEKGYESELLLLTRNLNELNNEYDNNIKLKNAFYSLMDMKNAEQKYSYKNDSGIVNEIVEKIIVCRSFFDVDRERCRLELDNIINKYGTEKNVSRETLK